MELARRHGDFAIAGVAFDLEIAGGVVTDGRLVYFGSEDKPTLARRRARGHPRQAARRAERARRRLRRSRDDLKPMSNPQGSAKMRLHLQRVLTRRALEVAAKRAGAAA